MVTAMKNTLLKTTIITTFFMCGFPGISHSQGTPENALQVFDSNAVSQEEGIFVNENDESAANGPLSPDEDPCPQPRAAYSETPSDLKVIQEDITRFTLCVQRAQLLERLNALALENTETINSALDKSIENIASEFAPAMPEMANVSAPPLPEVAQPEPATPQSSWRIQDIMGQSGTLKAVLINSQNNMVSVKKGDSLPGNNSKVLSVSATDVEISQNGQTTKLMWE